MPNMQQLLAYPDHYAVSIRNEHQHSESKMRCIVITSITNSTYIIILLPAKNDKEIKSLYMISLYHAGSLLASSEQIVLATYVVHLHLCMKQNGKAADGSTSER